MGRLVNFDGTTLEARLTKDGRKIDVDVDIDKHGNCSVDIDGKEFVFEEGGDSIDNTFQPGEFAINELINSLKEIYAIKNGVSIDE